MERPRPAAASAASLIFKIADIVLVLLLVSMVVMVFGNVVLRYGFNSGITVSEELSRFAFVWLTCLGAAVGVREGTHLGADFLVGALGPTARRVCFLACSGFILWACALIFIGAYRQHDINMANYAPVTGLPMEYVYGAVYVLSIGVGVLTLNKLWRLFTSRLSDRELFATTDVEEQRALEEGETVARQETAK
jgi:TRAP-type C4-dicarboxylate transport system permease small subunit